MYKRIEDFLVDWKNEREGTLKVFAELTDESLTKQIPNYKRTPGRLAWHIVLTIDELMSRTGLKLDGPTADASIPSKVADIIAAYGTASDSLYNQIRDTWVDSDLEVETNMYGEMWKKGMTLNALVKHEIHHRAQLTVLMRQLGLKVPGLYGPSEEEWAQMGSPAAE
ncbi:MAG: DinB family protein [Melioribacteraceae bacterium]|nr:DinB family protein [Melioribacteraceae bacterium]